MESQDKFYNSIKILLEKTLPGKKAHRRMSPAFRVIFKFFSIGKKRKKSAVLLLLYKNNTDYELTFIKRAISKGAHSGQIAFAGGKFEEQDKTIIDTALRETYEEIGINPEIVKVLGCLTKINIPVSSFDVYPVVGYISEKPDFKINKREVQYTISLKIKDLLSENAKTSLKKKLAGIPVNIPYYKINETEIWGATAMMLSEFLEIAKLSEKYL